MEPQKNLGKLIGIHGASPAFLQRAAIVAFLSLIFFIAMLIAFYIRQQLGYFLLASSFLVVNIFTMIGWWMQKRNAVEIFERGLTFKKRTVLWGEIGLVDLDESSGLNLSLQNDEKLILPRSTHGLDDLAAFIQSRLR